MFCARAEFVEAARRMNPISASNPVHRLKHRSIYLKLSKRLALEGAKRAGEP